MIIKKLLESKKFEIDTYKKSSDLNAENVSFTGVPEKHPHDPDKIILIIDPFSANVSYYEFDIADIRGVEELSSLVTAEGESVRMFNIWIKKGSVGIRSIPFVVEDTRAKQK
jgi:inorganic pyrophosphatase